MLNIIYIKYIILYSTKNTINIDIYIISIIILNIVFNKLIKMS